MGVISHVIDPLFMPPLRVSGHLTCRTSDNCAAGSYNTRIQRSERTSLTAKMSGLESAAKSLTFEAERQPHVLTIAGTSTFISIAHVDHHQLS
jgi:hypothetical protein